MRQRIVFNVLLGLAIGLPTLMILAARPVAVWLSRPLVIAEPPRPVDAIVVLGSGAYDEVTPTPEMAYRLLRGLQLLKSGYAPVMLLSGGGHRHSRVPDAQVMASVATKLGVERSSLILDPAPSTTASQAASIAALAGRHRIKSVALVTSPLHSFRASGALKKTGLEVVSAPAPPYIQTTPSTLLVGRDNIFGRIGMLSNVLYEYAAIALYWWRGWI